MNRMKKLVAILLTMALLAASLAVTSFASDGGAFEKTNDVVLRSPLCPNCEQGELFQQPAEYGDWRTVGRTPCSHGDFWGWDEIQERVVIITYTCSFCGVSSSSTTTEQQIVHHSS